MPEKRRRDSIRPGDHIYSDLHHGIYVGKATVTNSENEQTEIYDAVIYFVGDGKFKIQAPCGRCGLSSRRLGIVITCLYCFLDGNLLYVYEYDVSYWTLFFSRWGTGSVHPSRPVDEVQETAFGYLRYQNFGIIDFNNCWDFATRCKIGHLIG
ncbi:hypothetical protein DITRI_Ditri20bG0034900 [Diplodiscus trichospermus]